MTDGNGEYSYAGAEYDIYRTRDNALVTHITMDGNGHASYQLDPNESYYAVETKAPQVSRSTRDISSSRPVTAPGNSSSRTTLVCENYRCKKDSATSGNPQTSLSLEGAEYKCTSISTPGWEATGKTDANGVLWFDRVPLGEIQIVETKHPPVTSWTLPSIHIRLMPASGLMPPRLTAGPSSLSRG